MPRPAAADPATVQARIMKAAESQLRRYGPDKLTVGDIAKECGMSHPNLYRFYSCKNAILQAVTTGWLRGIEDDLREVAARPGTASERMEAFFLALHRAKYRVVTDDPELFRLHHALVEKSEGVLEGHIQGLSNIGALIVRDGIRDGEFPSSMPEAGVVRIFRDAMARFYHPHIVEETVGEGDAEERLTAIVRLLVDGLRARAAAERGSVSLTRDGAQA